MPVQLIPRLPSKLTPPAFEPLAAQTGQPAPAVAEANSAPTGRLSHVGTVATVTALPCVSAAVRTAQAVATGGTSATSAAVSSEGVTTTAYDSRQIDALRAAGVPEMHIQVALRRQRLTHEPLTEIMRPSEYGFLTPERLAKVHARMSTLDYFSPQTLDELQPQDVQAITQALTNKGVHISKMEPLLPVRVDDDGQTLTLLVSEPRDVVKAQQLYPGFKHRAVIGSERTLQTLYRRHFAQSGKDALDLYRALKNIKVDDDGADLVLRDFVMSLLRHGCYLGASDVALSPMVNGNAGVVRYKVGGAGAVFTYLEAGIWQRVITHILNTSGAAQSLQKGPVETRWEFKDTDREKYQEIIHRYGFRVEILQRRANEGQGITVVMRILDQQSEAADLDALGFDDDTLQYLRQSKDRATGLFLVTGPTGSGKTTTLYALLNEIDPVTRWIESIENPIEYAKGLWMQFQTRTGADEAHAAQDILKGLLRAAPDVILFGEIRKADIAKELMDAANTGHLVWGTFHTNNASSTIGRLKGFEVDMDMLASLLAGILAQRLLRTLCSCKEPDSRHETLEALNNLPFLGRSQQQRPTPYRAVGCPNCNHTGYIGRRMVYELLKITPKVQELIEQGASPRRIAQEGVSPEQTLAANAMRLLALGITSIEEASRLAE